MTFSTIPNVLGINVLEYCNAPGKAKVNVLNKHWRGLSVEQIRKDPVRSFINGRIEMILETIDSHREAFLCDGCCYTPKNRGIADHISSVVTVNAFPNIIPISTETTRTRVDYDYKTTSGKIAVFTREYKFDELYLFNTETGKRAGKIKMDQAIMGCFATQFSRPGLCTVLNDGTVVVHDWKKGELKMNGKYSILFQGRPKIIKVCYVNGHAFIGLSDTTIISYAVSKNTHGIGLHLSRSRTLIDLFQNSVQTFALCKSNQDTSVMLYAVGVHISNRTEDMKSYWRQMVDSVNIVCSKDNKWLLIEHPDCASILSAKTGKEYFRFDLYAQIFFLNSQYLIEAKTTQTKCQLRLWEISTKSFVRNNKGRTVVKELPHNSIPSALIPLPEGGILAMQSNEMYYIGTAGRVAAAQNSCVIL